MAVRAAAQGCLQSFSTDGEKFTTPRQPSADDARTSSGPARRGTGVQLPSSSGVHLWCRRRRRRRSAGTPQVRQSAEAPQVQQSAEAPQVRQSAEAPQVRQWAEALHVQHSHFVAAIVQQGTILIFQVE